MLSNLDSNKKTDGILTLNREYVKSVGEMRIANYLFKHQINYGYEELYEELYSYNNYRPDFTIKLNDGEKIEQAEERRLFYVALTRTKNFMNLIEKDLENKVYLLEDENKKRRSTFVNELNEIIKK